MAKKSKSIKLIEKALQHKLSDGGVDFWKEVLKQSEEQRPKKAEHGKA